MTVAVTASGGKLKLQGIAPGIDGEIEYSLIEMV